MLRQVRCRKRTYGAAGQPIHEYVINPGNVSLLYVVLMISRGVAVHCLVDSVVTVRQRVGYTVTICKPSACHAYLNMAASFEGVFADSKYIDFATIGTDSTLLRLKPQTNDIGTRHEVYRIGPVRNA